MGVPISIRLADDVREEREGQARDVRRDRIRAASSAVGKVVSASPDAKAFYAD